MLWQSSERRRWLTPRGEAGLLDGERSGSMQPQEKHELPPVRRRD
jgi:hypothetical protein